MSLQLPRNELHVWHLQLPDQLQNTEHYIPLLDQAEKHRLNSFLQPLMRQNYLLIRASVRNILGDYLKCPPAQVNLSTNPYNKPQLCPQKEPVNLQFSISHSANRAVIALALDAPVGIDLEFRHRKPNIQALLRRYFSPKTAAEIEALPEAARNEAFLRVWTRFEAYKKAMGTGLRGGDQAIYIPCLSQPVDRFHPLFPGDNQRGHWLTAEIDSEPGALISVVVDETLEPTAIKHFFQKFTDDF